MSFLTLCMANFGMAATSLVEIWMTTWSSTSTSHKIFYFLERMVLSLSSSGLFFFLVCFFFTQDFLPLLIFPRAKIFPEGELPRVNFVKCAM